MTDIADFIEAHKDDDLNRLALSASRFPDIDLPYAVAQIDTRRRLKNKLPEWCANLSVVFPSRLSAEQCSSEITAVYKQRLVGDCRLIADITGGLGVDSYYLSKMADKLLYIERNDDYCAAAGHNFSVLGADNIEIINGKAELIIDKLPCLDLIYADPARRNRSGGRVFAIDECEPNIIGLLPQLRQHCRRLLVKLSTMADISMTLSLLPDVVAVHILAVGNECRETLFELEQTVADTPPIIHCVNITVSGSEQCFAFTMPDERASAVEYSSVGKYLYEPNAAILKGGAFKSIAAKFLLKKLHPSSHLYTSNHIADDFPGRIFSVEEVVPFSKDNIRNLRQSIPKANISVRNFPLRADELKRKLRISDGGDDYIFATTAADGAKILLLCRKS
jgi:hypothetical protein